ncbi:hypothetical protein PCYB_005280, partial [Plasmodium cynomolgi strain B]
QDVFSQYDGIYQICLMFAKNLKEIDQIMKTLSDSNERCRYLYFWTNDQIKMLDSNHKVQGNAIYSIATALFYRIIAKIYVHLNIIMILTRTYRKNGNNYMIILEIKMIYQD